MKRKSPKSANLPVQQTKNAVIYVRVSSKLQDREGYSLDAQIRLLGDYAEANGLRVVKKFVEVETAKASGRKAFGEMVEYFRANREICRTLLVEKADRLTRNFRDAVTIDSLELDIVFVKAGARLSPQSSPEEKLMFNIGVAMSKHYIDNLGREASKGMAEKARQGIWPSSAPMGYRNVVGSSGKRIVEVDPVEGPILKMVFERYATGECSVDQVAKMAEEAGLKGRYSRNLAVYRSKIHHALRNPFYMGEFWWSGELYQGTYEPLVSRDVFNEVQRHLSAQCQKPAGRCRKKEWSFQGLVSCGHCGCTMTVERKKGRYTYYHCTGQKGKCPEKWVPEAELERQLREALVKLHLGPEAMEAIKTALKTNHVEFKRERDSALAALHGECARIQARMSRLYEDRLDGILPVEEYKRLSSAEQEKLNECRVKIAAHDQADRSYFEEGLRILELADRATELFDRVEGPEKGRFLDIVLSNPVWKDGKLATEYRQPFDSIVVAWHDEKDDGLLKNSECPRWLGRMGSNHRMPDPKTGALPLGYAPACRFRQRNATHGADRQFRRSRAKVARSP